MAGVPAGPENGGIPSVPPTLSRRDKGLLFFLWSVPRLDRNGVAGKLMANRICFALQHLSEAISFFWLTCTSARPPVSTCKLSAPLPAAGLSRP